MNFLKGILGIKTNSLDAIIASTGQIPIELYQVSDSKRIKKVQNGLSIIKKVRANEYKFYVENCDNDQEFNFPIHDKMKLISFPLGTQKYCFEWQLQQQSRTIIGVKVKIADRERLRNVLCLTIKEISPNKQLIADPLNLCKQLTQVPLYQNKIEQKQGDINKILLYQKDRPQSKLVSSGRFYVTIEGKRQLQQDIVAFVVVSKGNFVYSIEIIDRNNKLLTQKAIEENLHYQINIKQSFIKWLDIKCFPTRIYEVVFEKFDIAMNVKFVLQECFYQMKTKLIMKDNLQQPDRMYLRAIQQQPQQLSSTLIKIYKDPKSYNIDTKKIKTFVQPKAIQKYEGKRMITQSKLSQKFMLVALADKFQMLSINQNNQIKNIKINELVDLQNKPIFPQKTILHDLDNKALINAENGRLYYTDLVKNRIISQYRPSQLGLKDIVAEKKLAQTNNYDTFVGIDNKNIFKLDLRVGKTGIAQSKLYATNPFFSKITTTTTGNVAIGSQDGQIRLYKGINKNANTKYPALGDPVIHLETTKDSKWLLATYEKYLILLPTFQNDRDLYQNKIKIQKRPKPIKLTIKVDHLAICGVSELKLLPAKFDETKQQAQKFIVSGFSDYVVIWSFSAILRGNLEYTYSKVNDPLSVAEFQFNNPKILLMTTNKNIKIQESKMF